jgi:hypothetical protein
MGGYARPADAEHIADVLLRLLGHLNLLSNRIRDPKTRATTWYRGISVIRSWRALTVFEQQFLAHADRENRAYCTTRTGA